MKTALGRAFRRGCPLASSAAFLFIACVAPLHADDPEPLPGNPAPVPQTPASVKDAAPAHGNAPGQPAPVALPGQDAALMPDAVPPVPKPAGDPLWQAPPDEPAPAPLVPPAAAGSNAALLRGTPVGLRGAADDNSNAITQTAMHQALSSGTTFGGGVNGIVGSIGSPFLSPAGDSEVGGFHFGALTVHTNVALGVTAISETSSEAGSQSETYGTATFGISAVMGDNDRNLTFRDSIGLSYPSNAGGTGTVNTGGANTGISSPSSSNGFTQSLALTGAYAFPKLSVGFGFTLADLSGINRDAGANAESDLATLSLTSKYPIDPKLSLGWDLTFPIQRTEGAISSGGITSTNSLDYQMTPKTSLGIGATFGALAVDQGTTQIFEQLTLRVNYATTAKLSFNGNFGGEHRTAGDTSTYTPVFGFGATWTPTPRATVTLTGTRGVLSSGTVQNTNYTSTAFQLSGTQQIGTRFSATASISYENAVYSNVGSTTDAAAVLAGSRSDQFVTLTLGLSAKIRDRFLLSLTVAGGEDFSNQDSFKFIQSSAQITVTF